MGVTHLWETLNPSGRPVSLASFRNKTLAVDVSLWMHQAVNGTHKHGAVDINDTHSVVLFNRICALLQHGIKPIFVFDGRPPELKRATIDKRRALRRDASVDSLVSQPFSVSSQSCSTQRRNLAIVQRSWFVSVAEESEAKPSCSKDGNEKVLHQMESANDEDKGTCSNDSAAASRRPVGLSLMHCSTRHGEFHEKIEFSSSQSNARKLKCDTDASDTDSSSQPSISSTPLRHQPRRSCKSTAILTEENFKADSYWSDYGVCASGESQTSTVNSDDEVQFISCSVRAEKKSTSEQTVASPARKSRKNSIDSVDSSPLPSRRKRSTKHKRSQQSTEVRTMRTADGKYRLCSAVTAAPTDKVFPLFNFRVPHPVLGRVPVKASPGKRWKASAPSKVPVTDSINQSSEPSSLYVVDLTGTDSDEEAGGLLLAHDSLNDSNQPENVAGSGLDTLEVEGEGEKTFTEEQMTDEYWHDLVDPMISETLLAGGDDDVTASSQSNPCGGSQFLTQTTRQRNGPSIALPDGLKENYQSLMDLFGVPFLEGPGEAEAQCAHLEVSSVTAGTITDDGDVLLFGGRKVYRHFFKDAAEFDLSTITAQLELDREKLVAFAILTGSDYSSGIKGVGPVRAMEILAEFGGQGLQSLHSFSDWWRMEHAEGKIPQKLTKFRKSILKHILPDNFPEDDVIRAYLHPEVDETRYKFRWGKPDFDALTQFAGKKFLWEGEKIEKALRPVRKAFCAKGKQMSIEEYYTRTKCHASQSLPCSQRMGNAVRKLKDASVKPGSVEKPSKTGSSRKKQTPNKSRA